jgi:hypothetical protein
MKRLLIIGLLLMATTLQAQAPGLTVDRIYKEIMAPRINELEEENYRLRVQITLLTDQNMALQKQLAATKPAVEKPEQ